MTKAPHQPQSVAHTESRAAAIRNEAAEAARRMTEEETRRQERQAKREAETRDSEIDMLEDAATRLTFDDAREQLLQHIRDMREVKPAEPPPPPPRTARMEAELKAEQEAGRAAVAKAEAEIAYTRELQRKVEAERVARDGRMEPVYHANPSQNEQYPALKATLGKK
jgi:hypothetical protein